MDQMKIGRFIAAMRKEKGWTQEQLAQKLGVSNRSVSRWETGKNMPDLTLFQPLCEQLNISVNELLSGERIATNELKETSDQNLIDYSGHIERRMNRKMKKTVFITIAALFLASIVCVLSWNKTFFRTRYESDYCDNVSVPIPLFSFYRGTGGMYNSRFKTLVQPDEINVFCDQYLATLESYEIDGETYYYNAARDFTILHYRANNDGVGFINTIYLSYCDGRYGEE